MQLLCLMSNGFTIGLAIGSPTAPSALIAAVAVVTAIAVCADWRH